MTLLNGLLLFAVALLGGALNSVAGGGSFLTFPSLLFAGVSPISANATSSVALWPGSVASVGAYRKDLEDPRLLTLLAVVSIIGGLLGAELLLHTPQSTFVRLIPFLLLIATLLFAFGPILTARLRDQVTTSTPRSTRALAVMVVVQLVIASYGGYFGGGIGILMLAGLAVLGMDNIHRMNAVKTLLASCINGVAVITFILAGAVYWPAAIVMVIGGIIGGYGGAYYARMLNPAHVRRFVILVGCVMTVIFFVRE